MGGGLHDSSLSCVQPFFEALLAGDASGRSWLPALLDATPNGRSALGELVDAPGSLEMGLTLAGVSGRRACFDYPSAPPPELLDWFIGHPEELVWPPDTELLAETTRLRRALIYDDPPGSRARAQDRARELLGTRSSLSMQWWRFEDVARLGCLLMTDRLVITIEGTQGEALPPATDWYPRRSPLARNLEAAKQLAKGRAWASLLMSEEPLPDATDDHLADVLAVSTPHLSARERRDLQARYLGNLTWQRAYRMAT